LRQEKLFGELLALAQQLGLEIKEESGDFNGGFCRIQEGKYIFINRNHNLAKKISVLVRALSNQSLEGIYLLPAIRELLEEERGKAKPG
jgi:LPS sulfotransferase NodH